MMGVRRAALDRFGERNIKLRQPMAQMEEVLVPLYLHHRYQVTAAASPVGGIDYIGELGMAVTSSAFAGSKSVA